MNSIYIYGEILYKSMRYIKGKCSKTYKFKTEVMEHIRLWNLCLTLMLDEVINKADRSGLLTEYINANRKAFACIDIDHVKTDCPYVAFPSEAVDLMVGYIAQINIDILNYRQNFRKINRYLFALHNLPRCLLDPRSKEYISQKDAIEYSLGYLKQGVL